MNLTAKEQYELVKDHPEVFCRVLKWHIVGQGGDGFWIQPSGGGAIADDVSALTLTALFMLAAECGVKKELDGLYRAFRYGMNPDSQYGFYPLAAAVAAYKRRSGT